MFVSAALMDREPTRVLVRFNGAAEFTAAAGDACRGLGSGGGWRRPGHVWCKTSAHHLGRRGEYSRPRAGPQSFVVRTKLAGISDQRGELVAQPLAAVASGSWGAGRRAFVLSDDRPVVRFSASL
jgi:hypothetical protein